MTLCVSNPLVMSWVMSFLSNLCLRKVYEYDQNSIILHLVIEQKLSGAIQRGIEVFFFILKKS